ncbi:oligosaccharide flippase family protein [Celeribacter neptunius]|uniref:Membrane protein involved in the export of O-antigen and teichoic acid n=1 Tax=Celeribacter neptunius TaxID=588602 RepID=A0A1I3SDE6_9RHOB|nr:oligosaccharide flippase family protein [Celeribacter neptunius]SFJ56755.1 Membrane protein involved in the export of O-antigen and teichoic acid [Celeribacter neptunius]
MIGKVLVLLSGNAAASVMLLARNLIVARLIPVEDYGIAATFAVTMALIEMSTQFGLQQQIVQSKEGEDDRFQAALQGFQLMRGVLAGIIMFVLANPIAAFLKIPEIAWAYQVMAIMPVLRASQHFDIHRLNRSLRYGPMILTSAVPALISLIAVFPLAIWLKDYRVMLFALVLQEGLAALTSHVLAERKYRLVLDRDIITRSLGFGWPLLLNGALLFLVMQGDKLLVGRELGMASLGLFGMGITLTLTPTLILAKSTQNFFLPQLSAASNSGDHQAFDTMARAAFQAGLLNGMVMLLGVFALGVPLIEILLGDKYAPLQPLLIWLAAQQAIRVFKSGPSTAAVACAQTSNALYPNLLRVLGLPVAWWIVLHDGGLWHVIVVALVAEGLGYALALALAHWRLNIDLRPLVPSVIAISLVIAAALAQPALFNGAPRMWTGFALLILGPLLVIVSMKDLRTYARNHLRPTTSRKKV